MRAVGRIIGRSEIGGRRHAEVYFPGARIPAVLRSLAVGGPLSGGAGRKIVLCFARFLLASDLAVARRLSRWCRACA